jgi:hypothetical protein
MSMAPGALHAMLTAMLILVLPALVICLGITYMALQRRDQSPRSIDNKPEQRRPPV